MGVPPNVFCLPQEKPNQGHVNAGMYICIYIIAYMPSYLASTKPYAHVGCAFAGPLPQAERPAVLPATSASELVLQEATLDLGQTPFSTIEELRALLVKRGFTLVEV